MSKIIIYLSSDEIERLRELSEREVRPLRDQARFIIQRELNKTIAHTIGGGITNEKAFQAAA